MGVQTRLHVFWILLVVVPLSAMGGVAEVVARLAVGRPAAFLFSHSFRDRQTEAAALE